MTGNDLKNPFVVSLSNHKPQALRQALKKQLFCGWKIMNLPTTKNPSNSERQGCFLVTPCPARGAYIAQGERKILNLTALGCKPPSRSAKAAPAVLAPVDHGIMHRSHAEHHRQSVNSDAVARLELAGKPAG